MRIRSALGSACHHVPYAPGQPNVPSPPGPNSCRDLAGSVTTEKFSPFADFLQTETVVFGPGGVEADPPVPDLHMDVTVGSGQFHLQFPGLAVTRGIGEQFMNDAEQRGSYRRGHPDGLAVVGKLNFQLRVVLHGFGEQEVDPRHDAKLIKSGGPQLTDDPSGLIDGVM